MFRVVGVKSALHQLTPVEREVVGVHAAGLAAQHAHRVSGQHARSEAVAVPGAVAALGGGAALLVGLPSALFAATPSGEVRAAWPAADLLGFARTHSTLTRPFRYVQGVRRYDETARVEVDPSGSPARFHAWGRTYLVVEVLGPHWEEQAPWWVDANRGRPLEELTVRHWRVRARGARRDAVVELTEQAGVWHVVGVED